MDKKVVSITGSSSDIGKETAKLLVEKGFTVYDAARRTEKCRIIFAQNLVRPDV